MAGIPFEVGQVFTGAAMGAGDTGQISFVQTASVSFTAGPDPFISNFTITKDILGSAQSFPVPPFGTIALQKVTITSVDFNGDFTLTQGELPPGTIPPEFPLPFTARGVVLGLSVQTNLGTFSAIAGECAEVGSLALMGAIHISAFGQTLDAGGGILSIGPQTTGNVNLVFLPTFAAACFAQGTRLRTVRGEVAIETLGIGEHVVSAFGGTAPVVWLGHRHVDCRRHPRPAEVWPVRVCAGAFGPGRPAHDLKLSPDHAVFVPAAEGRACMLVPVRHLVNGASIVQEAVEAVTYWHVELPAHDVVLAEGLGCESYLDTGNRAAFANGGTQVMAHADFARRVWAAQGCAELMTGGPAVAAVHAELLARAETLGHAITTRAELALIVDGVALRPARSGMVYGFVLPPGARRGMLVSRRFVPARMEPGSGDHRRLGVAVAALALDGRAVDLSAPVAGWHAPEVGLRWTDGAGEITLDGAATLSVTLARTGLYWRDDEAPVAA